MKYTQLGRTGLKVSRLVLGTMNFGPQTDEADSHAIMDAALDAGINYLRHRQRVRLGREQGPYRGDHRQLVRQGRRPPRQDGPRHQGVREHGRRGRRLAQPRQALRREHPAGRRGRASSGSRPTTSTSTSSTTSTGPPPSRRSGRRSTSWSSRARSSTSGPRNFPGYKIAQANEIAARRGGTIGLVSEQCLYNLAERRAEMEVIPAAQEYGLGVIPWSPLHGGLLGGVHQEGGRGRPTGERPGRRRPRQPGRTRPDPGVRGPARQARPRARRGRAWPGCSPGRASPARSSARAPRSSWTRRCARSNWTCREEFLTALDEIFPGPGPSPEAFAW